MLLYCRVVMSRLRSRLDGDAGGGAGRRRGAKPKVAHDTTHERRASRSESIVPAWPAARARPLHVELHVESSALCDSGRISLARYSRDHARYRYVFMTAGSRSRYSRSMRLSIRFFTSGSLSGNLSAEKSSERRRECESVLRACE